MAKTSHQHDQEDQRREAREEADDVDLRRCRLDARCLGHRPVPVALTPPWRSSVIIVIRISSVRLGAR